MDWQVVLNDLKSRYRALTYLMAQPKADDEKSDFFRKKKEMLEEVTEIMRYWNDDVISKIHEPVPAVVSKEFNNVRYECMILMDYYEKLSQLMFD